SSSNSIFFIRDRPMTTLPASSGAEPPYPRFLPRLIGQTGLRYWLATRSAACTSSTLVGAIAPEGTCAASSIANVSAYPVRSSGAKNTLSAPSALSNARCAWASFAASNPGGRKSSAISIRSEAAARRRARARVEPDHLAVEQRGADDELDHRGELVGAARAAGKFGVPEQFGDDRLGRRGDQRRGHGTPRHAPDAGGGAREDATPAHHPPGHPA